MVAFVNNTFIDEEKAVLGIGDLSIQRGYGIFDFFRTSNYIPLFLDDYLDRFYKSAKILRLQPLHNREELRSIISDMIRLNNQPAAGFKMILTGGYSADGFEPATPNFIIGQHPVQLPSPEKFNKGVRILLHDYMRDIPHAKSINYLVGIYLTEKLQQQMADEVLYYHNNYILEFPRSNVFIITKDRTIVTPAKNVLPGITRMKVLELASGNHKVEERDVTVGELKNASEIFITSTTKRILPVVHVDGKTIGDGKPGEITTSLYYSFLEMEARICKRETPVLSSNN
ncbi:MAG: hypothetical protein JWQ40_3347 [Segetibacter sp.]|nr:hypothetical protein [Segetibacter sp.]